MFKPVSESGLDVIASAANDPKSNNDPKDGELAGQL
jgi:hypothetical protein